MAAELKNLYHATLSHPLKHIRDIHPGFSNTYPDLGKVVFASSLPGFAACFGTRWNDDQVKISIIHSENNDMPKEANVKQVIFQLLKPDEVDLESPCSMYFVMGRFRFLEYTGGLKQYATVACGIITEVAYKSFKDMLKAYNVVLIGDKITNGG